MDALGAVLVALSRDLHADQFGHHSGLRRRNLEKAEQLESSAETLRRMLARG